MARSLPADVRAAFAWLAARFGALLALFKHKAAVAAPTLLKTPSVVVSIAPAPVAASAPAVDPALTLHVPT